MLFLLSFAARSFFFSHSFSTTVLLLFLCEPEALLPSHFVLVLLSSYMSLGSVCVRLAVLGLTVLGLTVSLLILVLILLALVLHGSWLLLG